MPALFEALLSRDPQTFEPRAALATHYEISADLTEFTFFLRGHPNPKGTKLPGAGGAPSTAFWSDGRPVTADDFVHAWRRIADPANGSCYAASLYPVLNGKEITEGKARPETLGVRAADPFTLRVSLKAPAAHFLKLASIDALAAVPRHAISSGGSSWTAAGRMPSCGPSSTSGSPTSALWFGNPRYYDAAAPVPTRLSFCPSPTEARS
jgi:oligopeptide transport system substrate-binding protein